MFDTADLMRCKPVKFSCPGHAQHTSAFAVFIFQRKRKYRAVSCKGTNLIALWRMGTVFTRGMVMRTEVYLSLGNGVSGE